MRLARLGEVATIDRSVASETECRELPYVGLESIEKGTGAFTWDFEATPETVLATKFRFTSKHVLYGKLRPYLNKVVLPSFGGVCSTEILPILPRAEVLDRVYLWAALLSPEFVRWASASVDGANLPRLSPQLLARWEIPVPPLSEQRRIAAVLTKADRLRRLRRYALELSEGYLQAVFMEMFGDPGTNPRGWQAARLGDVCAEIYRYPTFYGFDYVESGIPVVRIGNVLPSGSLDSDLSHYVFVPRRVSDRFPRTVLEWQDILMAVRGDGSTAERIGLVDCESLVGANISPNLLRFKARPELVDPVYLFWLLACHGGQRVLKSYITRTAKKTITATSIKDMQVPLPSQSAQREFSTIAQNVGRLRGQQQEALRQAEHLFETLLHRAFRGEL